MKTGSRWSVIWQGLGLSLLSTGIFRCFCQIFLIWTPVIPTVLLLTAVSFWVVVLMVPPYPVLEKRIVDRFQIPFIKNPLSLMLLLLSLLFLIFWAFSRVEELAQGMDILQELVRHRWNVYYRGAEEYHTVPHSPECVLLLYVFSVPVILFMAWAAFRMKQAYTALLPGLLVIGTGLFAGKTPGIRAMLLVCCGSLILFFYSEKRSLPYRRCFRRVEQSAGGREREKTFLGGYAAGGFALAALLVLALLAARQTGSVLLSTETEKKLLDFQHRQERRIVEKMNETLQQLQRMSGVGAGVLGNQAPKYTGKTMLTITLPEQPEEDIYLRGFVGVQYEDGCWYERRPFQREFTEEDAEAVLSQGYYYQQGWQGASRRLEMTIQYAGANHSTYALMPYDSLYSENGKTAQGAMAGRKLNADLNVKRKLGCRAYVAKCYLGATAGGEEYSRRVEGDTGEILLRDDILYYAEVNHLYQSFVQETYCQIPDGLLDFRMLLSSLWNTSEEQNFFGETVLSKVQMYLAGTAQYSLDLESRPSGQDYVENFLFEQKKGFCEHFATAGTLLLRGLGVPARYVAGYRVGPEEFTENDDGTYTAEIPDSDAHAWAEVYHRERGWIPAEMTPADHTQDAGQKSFAELVNRQMEQSSAVPESAAEPESAGGSKRSERNTAEPEATENPTPEPTATSRSTKEEAEENRNRSERINGSGAGAAVISQKLQENWQVFGWILILLFLAVLWQYQHLRRKRRICRVQGLQKRLLVKNRLLEEFLRQAGFRMGEGGEQERYIRFLGQIDGVELQMAERLYELLEKAAFSKGGISDEEFAWAEESLQQIGCLAWKQLPPFRKIYLSFIKNWRSSLTNGRNHSKKRSI